MESYFRNPRYCAANDIFDAGLRRSRHRNRIPVAAQSRGDPKDIDFGDRLRTTLIAMLAESHSSSCEQRGNLGVPSDGAYDCPGISIVERPGAFKQLSNALVLALHRSSGKSHRAVPLSPLGSLSTLPRSPHFKTKKLILRI